MPEISRFLGIVVTMYYEDHVPPHLHVRSGGQRARVRLEPVVPMDGRLPARLLAFVLEWATLHQAELLANWRRARAHEPLLRIPPLE